MCKTDEGRLEQPTPIAKSDTTRLRKSLHRISLIVRSEQFVRVVKAAEAVLRMVMMIAGS